MRLDGYEAHGHDRQRVVRAVAFTYQMARNVVYSAVRRSRTSKSFTVVCGVPSARDTAHKLPVFVRM